MNMLHHRTVCLPGPLISLSGLLALCCLWVMVPAGSVACAAEPARENAVQALRVKYQGAGSQPATVEARLMVEAQDGGLLLLAPDGRLLTVPPDRLLEREKIEQFTPLTKDELGQRLRQQLGDGFEIVETKHYVLCTSAGRTYGEWCGRLFERLLGAFQKHWRSRELDLHEPQVPLAAVVFGSRAEFVEFARKDAGNAAVDSQGYYSLMSNQMVLYDLTAGPGTRPARSQADITRRLAASPFNAATVVHEATHQIAFNCGMHVRLADNPLWLTEGMAMYFETPDLSSRSGWRTVGRVNQVRLHRFRDYAKERRPADSLSTLIASDSRLVDAEQAEDAYAEAWALSYWLIRTRRDEYLKYLAGLAKKTPLIPASREQRLAEFQAAFGAPPQELDREFLGWILRQR